MISRNNSSCIWRKHQMLLFYVWSPQVVYVVLPHGNSRGLHSLLPILCVWYVWYNSSSECDVGDGDPLVFRIVCFTTSRQGKQNQATGKYNYSFCTCIVQIHSSIFIQTPSPSELSIPTVQEKQACAWLLIRLSPLAAFSC